MANEQAGVVALVVALALASSSAFVLAQPEEEQPTEGAGGGEGEAEGGGEAGDDDDDDDDDDDEPTLTLAEQCEKGIIDDPELCRKIDPKDWAGKTVKQEMYAVQQIWVKRKNRLEINPYWGFTMNDQFVQHPGPGLALNYYIINPLAVGVNGNFYQGLNAQSDFNFETSRAARVGQPITEYQFNVNANLTYVPVYGKFAAFQNFIFHWDIYLLVGGGIISTRPIAVVDPDNRTFDWTIRPTWGLGGGIRIFFTRWLGAIIEIRDYMFLDDIENPAVAATVEQAQNPDTWLDDGQEFTNNVQAQIGLSVFIPPTWTYELPK
jgi:outer membrane beta-barrel protein